jgi:hypothetical protein
VSGVSRQEAGWINFDVEVSKDGVALYFVDGIIGQNGIPTVADLAIAHGHDSAFTRLANSEEIFKNINSSHLEYAAGISADQLELYFTRVELPITPSTAPAIFVSTRENVSQPFKKPQKLENIGTFVEAATIAPDQKTLYYHRKDNGHFSIYMIRKK